MSLASQAVASDRRTPQGDAAIDTFGQKPSGPLPCYEAEPGNKGGNHMSQDDLRRQVQPQEGIRSQTEQALRQALSADATSNALRGRIEQLTKGLAWLRGRPDDPRKAVLLAVMETALEAEQAALQAHLGFGEEPNRKRP